jgi:hypothetical protein
MNKQCLSMIIIELNVGELGIGVLSKRTLSIRPRSKASPHPSKIDTRYSKKT